MKVHRIAESEAAQPPPSTSLFKKLLTACCDSCERRASLAPGSIRPLELRNESTPARYQASFTSEGSAVGEDSGDEVVDNAFECAEAQKQDTHDELANMWLAKVALPVMEFVVSVLK